MIIAALLGVSFTHNPLKLIGALAILAIGSAFFSCLSMTLAGVVVARDRLMGIGQAITMPLFFSSSALYPIAIMPGWLQVISKINPLTYEVEALRGLLIGTATTLWLDVTVLVGATIVSHHVRRPPPAPPSQPLIAIWDRAYQRLNPFRG